MPKEIIYKDLVGLIIPIRYYRSKYSLFLTNNLTCAIISMLLKEKCQVNIKLLKYSDNMQIQYKIIIQVF